MLLNGTGIIFLFICLQHGLSFEFIICSLLKLKKLFRIREVFLHVITGMISTYFVVGSFH
jgi:hypothetical protein